MTLSILSCASAMRAVVKLFVNVAIASEAKHVRTLLTLGCWICLLDSREARFTLQHFLRRSLVARVLLERGDGKQVMVRSGEMW